LAQPPRTCSLSLIHCTDGGLKNSNVTATPVGKITKCLWY